MFNNNGQTVEDLPPSGSWRPLIQSVLGFIGPRRRQYIAWALVLVVCQIYSLVPPLIIGNIVDFFLQYRHGQSLSPFYTNVLILGLGTAIAAYVRLRGKDKLGKINIETIYDAKVEGFDRLMRYPLSWHQRENTGNKLQRLQHGLNNLQHFMRVAHDDIPPLLISFVGVLGVFLFLDWIFAVFLLVYTAIFFGIEYYYYQRLQDTNHRFNQAAEASSGTYLESANNVLTVKMMGAADALKQNVDQAESTAKDLAYDSHRMTTRKWQHFQVINAIALAVFLLIVGQSVLAGTMTAGAIFVYFSYFQRLSDSASNGLNTILNLMQYKVAIERMLPIFTQSPRDSGGVDFPESWNDIVIDHGHYVHVAEGKQFTIEDLNLTISKGQRVGVVGRSGSGKSTVAKLLLGVYQLNSGSIKIGDVPLDQIDPHQLIKRVTIVPQETELFNLTLRQNITMMKDVEESLLQKAIEISCLQPIIDKLPQGLDTKVGEKGGRLSGGERQRIGIARAICADTEILVLDEATSALDSKTEIAVQQALETMLPGKTLIIIAHRLMTLNQVDKIVVFDKGRVVEQDAFNRLLTNPESLFAQMWKLQQVKTIAGTRRIDLSKAKQIYPSA